MIINKRGKLISIEGTEGAGKSTSITFIKNYLEEKGQTVLCTREPGGTHVGEEIRQILLHKHVTHLHAQTELLLMFAARVQHIHEVILPALEQGIWLITDRYIDASYAYQGGGRGLDSTLIIALDKLFVGSLYPHLTFLLDLPVEVGLTRVLKRNPEKDRIEREDQAFFERVRGVYLARAQEDPARIKLIDANQDLVDVEQAIAVHLEQFCARRASV